MEQTTYQEKGIKIMNELKNLRYDLDRWAYGKRIPISFIWLVLFIYPATWAVVIYRMGRLINKIPFRVIRFILKIPYFIIKRFIAETYLSVDISEGADIGPGLYIGHLGSIVVGTGVKAGKNFSIRQGVTLGGSGDKGLSHPKLGDNVIIAAGAIIIGEVNIGNNVMIGANAVVNKDIKDNGRAVGIPAKTINYDGTYGINIRPKWSY